MKCFFEKNTNEPICSINEMINSLECSGCDTTYMSESDMLTLAKEFWNLDLYLD